VRRNAIFPHHPPEVLDVHVEHLGGECGCEDLGVAARRRGSVALGKGHATTLTVIWDDYE
jgi:hypothetical protein